MVIDQERRPVHTIPVSYVTLFCPKYLGWGVFFFFFLTSKKVLLIFERDYEDRKGKKKNNECLFEIQTLDWHLGENPKGQSPTSK